MNLSMWIINDWLRKYHPVAAILSGEMVIEKVHLISNDIDKDKSTLIIGRIRDFFEESESNEVLLMNNNDVISLRIQELDTIFNEVSNAFVYHNRWEMQLLMNTSKDEPEQQIIDDSTELFGPMFLMDLKMNKIAMSKKYGIGTVNKVWDDMLTKGFSSLDTLEKLRDTWFFKNYASVQKNVVYEIDNVEEILPYKHGIIISQLNNDGKLIAQMIIAHKENFTISEIQLSSIIYKALNAIKIPQESIDNTEIVSNFFTFMLEDFDNIVKYKDFICSFNNWNETDEYCLAALRKKISDTSTNIKPVSDMLHILLNESIISNKNNHIITCINVSKNPQYLNQLSLICTQYGFHCGISYVFAGFDYILFMEKQCMEALNRSVKFFSKIAYEIIINNLEKSEFVYSCIHPVLSKLKSHDECNNTQFFETLKVYLQCERNWIESAKRMYVHRNTIIFRIEKLQSIFHLNLDDSEEREYLLFSYRLFKSDVTQRDCV